MEGERRSWFSFTINSSSSSSEEKKRRNEREREREKNSHAQLTQKQTNVLRVLQIKEVAEEKKPLTTDAKDEDEEAENCGEWRLCDETMAIRERTHTKFICSYRFVAFSNRFLLFSLSFI